MRVMQLNLNAGYNLIKRIQSNFKITDSGKTISTVGEVLSKCYENSELDIDHLSNLKLEMLEGYLLQWLSWYVSLVRSVLLRDLVTWFSKGDSSQDGAWI